MNVLPACASSHLSRPLCRRLLPFVKRKKSPRKTLVRTNQKHPRPRLQQQQQIARSRVIKISSTSLPKTTPVCKKKSPQSENTTAEPRLRRQKQRKKKSYRMCCFFLIPILARRFRTLWIISLLVEQLLSRAKFVSDV